MIGSGEASLQCRNRNGSLLLVMCVCVSFRIPQHDVTPAPAKAYLHTDLTSSCNTTTLAPALGERVEPEPRPRHRAHAHFRYCKQTSHCSHSTALLHSKHSSSSVPFRHSCRREQVYRRSSGRVIQRQSPGKRQILTPRIRFENSLITVFVRVLKHSGRIHLFIDFRRRFIFYYSAS